jgi:hypothetical protein
MRSITDEETASKNRADLRALLHQNRISMKKAAELIAAHTHRPCGYRTVKAWLADPTTENYRPCPSWAIDVMREVIDLHGVTLKVRAGRK